MNLLKIKMKELFFLVVISAIVGVPLYLENYNKIVYTIQVERGYVVSENYCNNQDVDRFSIISQSDFNRLKSKNYFNSFDFRTNFRIKNNSDTYEITFKGRRGQETQMHDQSIIFFNLLSQLENSIFKRDYEQALLHCNSKSFKLFKMVPLKVIDSQYQIRPRFKNYFEIVIAFIPMFIFYFGFLAFKFIKKMI